ncbi:MAG: rhamnan synthesis F family protein [Clostridiales bacterium]|nr:rhamnan synthesis F family protein [Clostridiales bacterium]
MKNIYDIREEENLLFIIDEDRTCEQAITGNAVVIVNLYYPDTVDRYVSYIDHIPVEIPVYVYSSRQEVLDMVRLKCGREKVTYHWKANRGRDISALLVTASEVVSGYEYVCFVHDKMAKDEYLKADIDYWVKNMWDNMLASGAYMKQVLHTFYQNPDLGLLVPPEPYGEYLEWWYDATWAKDFEITRQLADKLHLKADIDLDKPVFTLGTIFWARTEALRKLFEQQWKYEDFQDEPLPRDGTLSHAIERILGFVAQDAGYRTGTVMTSRYASRLLIDAQDFMRNMFYHLKRTFPIYNMHQARNWKQKEAELREFVSCYPRIYLYGAGEYGKRMLEYLSTVQMEVEGFLVSAGKRTEEYVEGVRVWELQELVPQNEEGIIIAANYDLQKELEESLRKNGFQNYMFGY